MTLRNKFFYSLLERPRPVTTLGTGNGAWNITTDGLNNNSCVVSAGIGYDISFDLAVHERFDCRVYLLDPTPVALTTISDLPPLPRNMTFVPLGLSGKTGNNFFSAQSNPEDPSFRYPDTPSKHDANSDLVSFPCKRLSAWMQETGLDHIDLLKLDIEGFEYDVIRDLVESRLSIDQICVEFHHGILSGISRCHTLLACMRLFFAEYTLIDHVGLNHTFVRK